MKQATFPLRVRMSAHALNELHSCEYGSYEDHIKRDSNGGVNRLSPYNEQSNGKFRLHCIEILERNAKKTVLILNSQQELDEVFCASMTGTWGIYCKRTALRVFDDLFDYVSEDQKVNIRRGSIGW